MEETEKAPATHRSFVIRPSILLRNRRQHTITKRELGFDTSWPDVSPSVSIATERFRNSLLTFQTSRTILSARRDLVFSNEISHIHPNAPWIANYIHPVETGRHFFLWENNPLNPESTTLCGRFLLIRTLRRCFLTPPFRCCAKLRSALFSYASSLFFQDR